jgi:DNA-directed RNA polymerase subunit RPC12/RpoP
LSGAEYECHKCNRVFSGEERRKSAFCPFCGTHLWPKYVKGERQREKPGGIERVRLTPDQINLGTLFEEFMRLKDFNCGEGVYFEGVPSWILARKEAYTDFRERFRQDKLVDWDKLREDFRDFLYFKNNKSWTTLYRSGLEALSYLEKLWKLLIFLQNETVDVRVRVKEGLLGKYYCRGIGVNILTALLHTFRPDKYGVWNSRTKDTLDLIRRTPKPASDPGHKYELINNELLQLRDELHTELTTVDSFMWFISKKVQVIE